MSQGILRRSVRVKRNSAQLISCYSSNLWMQYPLEMKFEVFNNLEVGDLKSFSLSSKSASKDVLVYLQSACGLIHIKKELFGKPTVIQNSEHYKHENAKFLGFLLRSVTLMMPRVLKVQVAFDIISQLKWTLNAEKECDDSYFLCFGIFLRSFCLGWHRSDLMQTYAYVQQLTRVESLVRKVLNSAPGRFAIKERAIRLFYHHAYFFMHEKHMIRFWLGAVLMSLPFVHQAKILYILFGPTRTGHAIDWTSQLSNSSLMICPDLTRFASVVSLLVDHDNFSDDDILTLIGEIIILPQPWHHFHVAHFLLSCGTTILVSYMSNILANGRYNDLCIFIFRCAWVLMKQGKEVTFILNSLGKALCTLHSNPADAQTFLEVLPIFLHRISHSNAGEVHGVVKDGVHTVVAELLRILLKHKRHLSEVFQPQKNISCRRIVVLREEG